MSEVVDIRTGRPWHPRGQPALSDSPWPIFEELRNPRFLAWYLEGEAEYIAALLDRGDILGARQKVEHLRYVVRDYAEAHAEARHG